MAAPWWWSKLAHLIAGMQKKKEKTGVPSPSKGHLQWLMPPSRLYSLEGSLLFQYCHSKEQDFNNWAFFGNGGWGRSSKIQTVVSPSVALLNLTTFFFFHCGGFLSYSQHSSWHGLSIYHRQLAVNKAQVGKANLETKQNKNKSPKPRGRLYPAQGHRYQHFSPVLQRGRVLGTGMCPFKFSSSPRMCHHL